MATEGNHFNSVNFEQSSLKVMIYFPKEHPLGEVVMHQCQDSDFTSMMVRSCDALQAQLEELRQQVALVVKVEGSSTVQEVSRHIQSRGLQHMVTLIGIISSIEKNSSLMNEILEAGFSRVLTPEDCEYRLRWELKLLKRNEHQLKERVGFGQALLEAVENGTDAVQIISDSKTMYVNRAFVNMSGYSRDEAVGKPAMDILKYFDNKLDNGPKGAFQKKEQSWDGECIGRRKSGSVLKQHLKLIPVRSTANFATHHVTIQRLLSYDEHSRPRATSAGEREVKKQNSLPSIPRMPLKLITPIMKAVQAISQARDNPGCPTSVREILDGVMEILRDTELYTPSRTAVPRRRGIVSGLLNGGNAVSSSDIALRISHPHHHIRHTPITPPPPQVQDALENIKAWDFDIIKLESGSSNEPLYYVGMHIFKQFEMCEVLNIDDTVVASWLKLMEQNYHRSNTYHNSTHAADVLQSTAYLIKALQDQLVTLGEMLEPMEIAGLLISAVTHDVDHPGRTNPFMCNTQDELALLYNDNAVLENHHVSCSFRLTQQHDQANIFQGLDTPAYRRLRASIVDLVLATDMAKHFEHLAKFNQSMDLVFPESEDGGSNTNLTTSSKESREKRLVIKRILVKCADIVNPCRPWELCKEWAQRIAEEYFCQTEEEKARGLPVVFPDFDRQTCKLHVTQVKFIDFFISGLFEAWHNYCPIPVLMKHLNSNYESWKAQCASPNSSEEEAEASL